MKTKVLWIDSSDILVSDTKLASLRRQLSDWEWVRFDESSFEDEKALEESLSSFLSTASMFDSGRVVYFFGTPKCYALLAKMLKQISKGVLLLIVAPATGDFYTSCKNAQKKAEKDIVRLEEPFKLTRAEGAKWIKSRAEYLQIGIDDTSCKMMLDRVGPDPNKLTLELKKLSLLSNPIVAWAVEQACSGTGEVDQSEFLKALTDSEGERAHVFLQRLLDRNEHPLAICGSICDWIRRSCIAESARKNPDAVFEGVSVKDQLDKAKSIKSGKPEKMFPKPGFLYYACKNISDRKQWYAHNLMLSARKLQIELKKGKEDPSVLLHRFVGMVIGENKNGTT